MVREPVSTAINRMQFLRGDFSGRAAPLRPPWALPEHDFIGVCDRCGHCMDVCPTGILKQARGGYPVVDFSAGECLFCSDCVRACKPGALAQAPGQQPWLVRASIDAGTCIAQRGVECRGCVDPCEIRAIRMRPRVGSVAIPELDLTSCTGCGACYRVCPVQAIVMQAGQMTQEAR